MSEFAIIKPIFIDCERFIRDVVLMKSNFYKDIIRQERQRRFVF